MKTGIIKYIGSVLVLALVLILSACVSQKKKGEVSKVAKFYHNTTAHYNGYFNANEIMMETKDAIIESHQDNYNEILPIYPEYLIPNPESIAEDMDKAIEKVAIVASVHEPSRWVDDCYIILGKAQFMKQDYESAEETFLYFIEEFDPSIDRRKSKKSSKTKKSKKNNNKAKSVKEQRREREKKKKANKKKKSSSSKKTNKKETAEEKKARLEKERIAAEEQRKKERELENSVEIDRSSNGLLKHLPAFPEGLLWVAKTYVVREKHNLVEFYLNKIEEQPEVHKAVLNEIPVVKAFNAMEQKDYQEAIVHLDEAIPMQKDKSFKARLVYIRSQLHQEVGDNAAAFAGFNQVIDMKPEFIMEFNAALRMLKNSMGSSGSSLAVVERKLNKMLKEDKYKDFHDQIYFTLGEINYEKGDLENAVPYFRKGIQASKGNTAQLTEAYYILAKIFYDTEDYVLAKNYYDSTSSVITKTDERFFEVDAYAKNLKEIAENIIIIDLQDSLIRLSKKSPDERAEIARKLKKAELLAEAAKKGNDDDDDEVSTSGLRRIDPSRGASRGGIQSTWWAYDENKRVEQVAAFRNEWGIRSLEDDWRRSSKASSINDIDNLKSNDELDLSDDEINQILKDVPLTPDALAASKLKIQNALFELGVLFRERIENYNKAIEAHVELQDRFPGSKKEVDALYYLYLSHLDIDDQPKANYYLNTLKSKYPNDKYTLSLVDPTYIENILAEGRIQETMYNKAYNKFEEGDYKAVIALEKNARDKFKKENEFGSKYALLSAMSTGKLEGRDAYVKSLKTMIATYPNTDEETRAKEILRFLNGDEEAFAQIDEGEAQEAFKANDDKLHYICVIVTSKKDSDLNAAKISISNYNRKYHKVDRIRLSSTILSKDNNTDVILLRKFSNKEKAMKYYQEVERNKKEFMEPKVNYDIFAITQQNYREVMKKKSVKEYEIFFESSYL